MDLSVKEENQIETLNFIEETIQCCLLCHDIRKLLNSLIDHMKEFHFEDLKSPNKLKLCNCQEISSIKSQILNHVFNFAFLNRKENYLEMPTTDYLSIEEQKNENSDTESSKPKRKRKLKILNFPKPIEKIQNENFLPPIRHSQFLAQPEFACEFCPKILYTRSGLNKHYNAMHNPENRFKCSKCTVGHCNTLKNLHAHMRVHGDVQLSLKICEKCNKQFDTEKQLYHHMLLHREKLLECAHCEMKFNMKQPLLKHIYAHFNIRLPRYENVTKSLCEICSKWVASSRMKRHLSTHYNDIRVCYKCDFPECEKAFTELRNLQDHQNMHKNLKPYVCEFCSIAFRHRAALRQHRVRHIEPEKHKCEICMECFVTNQSLRKHMKRQHQDGKIDVRPFACDFDGCNSTFKYEDFLMRHKKEVHNPKPQEEKRCEFCSYIAKNAKNYFQHMRRTHNIKKRINNRVFPLTAINLTKKKKE